MTLNFFKFALNFQNQPKFNQSINWSYICQNSSKFTKHFLKISNVQNYWLKLDQAKNQWIMAKSWFLTKLVSFELFLLVFFGPFSQLRCKMQLRKNINNCAKSRFKRIEKTSQKVTNFAKENLWFISWEDFTCCFLDNFPVNCLVFRWFQINQFGRFSGFLDFEVCKNSKNFKWKREWKSGFFSCWHIF